MTAAASAAAAASLFSLGRTHQEEIELELVVKPEEEVVVVGESESEIETEQDEDEENDALLVVVAQRRAERGAGASDSASAESGVDGSGGATSTEGNQPQAKTRAKTKRNRTTCQTVPFLGIFMVVAVTTFGVLASTTALIITMTSSNNNHNKDAAADDGSNSSSPKPSSRSSSVIRVAHIGNSIQYYNDCPRLLEHMFRTRFGNAYYQNSCLRGGATLTSVLEKGNGMKTKFSSSSRRPNDNGNVSLLEDGRNSSFDDIGAPTVEDLLLHDDRYPKHKPTATTTASRSSPSSASPSSFSFDFVVMNDHTQSPARSTTRQQTIEVLKSHYVPLIQQMAASASALDSASSASASASASRQESPRIPTIVFIQTAAYRSPGVKNSDDLGTFDEFTTKLQEGYQEYVDAVVSTASSSTQSSSSSSFPSHTTIRAKIAPVGTAYQYIRQQQQQQQKTDYELLWSKLYARDGFHPSPLGTYLQACVLYCTITDEPPPLTYDVKWWDTARYMQPVTTTTTNNGETTAGEEEDNAVEGPLPLPLPTSEEAKILRGVACRVCGIGVDTHDGNGCGGGDSRL